MNKDCNFYFISIIVMLFGIVNCCGKESTQYAVSVMSLHRKDLQDGCDGAMLEGKLGSSKLSGTLRKLETSRRIRAKRKKINFCRF